MLLKTCSAYKCFHNCPCFQRRFSSIPTRDFTSQKPESLNCEHTVAPPAIAAVVHARYKGDNSEIPGIAAIIPAAIVIATVEEPTQIRTNAATINARTTIGSDIEDTAFPIKSPRPEYCNTYRSTPPHAVTNKIKPVGSNDFCHYFF